MGAVCQTGQWIVAREVADPLEGRFSFGDLLADAAHGEDRTVIVEFGLHVGPEPAIRADFIARAGFDRGPLPGFDDRGEGRFENGTLGDGQ